MYLRHLLLRDGRVPLMKRWTAVWYIRSRIRTARKNSQLTINMRIRMCCICRMHTGWIRTISTVWNGRLWIRVLWAFTINTARIMTAGMWIRYWKNTDRISTAGRRFTIISQWTIRKAMVSPSWDGMTILTETILPIRSSTSRRFLYLAENLVCLRKTEHGLSRTAGEANMGITGISGCPMRMHLYPTPCLYLILRKRIIMTISTSMTVRQASAMRRGTRSRLLRYIQARETKWLRRQALALHLWRRITR